MSKIQYIDGIPMGIDRTKVPRNLAKPKASHAVLGEVPKCEAESYMVGKVCLQRLHFNWHWYAIYNNKIIDHDQYRHDLEERVRHFA